MKRYLFSLVIIAIFSLTIAREGDTTVFDPAAMGGRSFGMGSAMVGIADDLISAFYFNPAGLVLAEGSSIAAGMIVGNPRLRYESPAGYSEENAFDGFVPFLAFATDMYDPVIIGVGIYSTLGVGFEFRADPDHGINNNIKSRAGVVFLSPTVAYEITPRLAIGVEFNIGYSKSNMNQPTPFGYLKTKTDGIGFGATFGLLYKINPSLNLGLCWRTPMKTPEDGDAYLQGVKDDLDRDFYWPQMLTVGIGYDITPDLTFGLSLKWSDWPHFDHSKMEFKDFSFLNTRLTQDSRDGYRLQMGIEYRPTKNIALRTGYFYDRSSFSSRWISPALLDCSFHEARVGIGIRFGRVQIDTGFSYSFYETRRVSESLVGYPGKYGGNMPAAALEITYHFKR